MAHEITNTNGKDEIAYIGQTPWHGLGQVLTEDAPIEKWIVEAGMDWTIERQPVTYTYGGALKAFTDKHVLTRSDNGNPLAVVGDNFKLVQPAECLEFFRDLVGEAGGFKLETAGTLFGGRKFWALARLNEQDAIGGVDKVGGYLLLATATDGTMNTVAKHVITRVVCNNTMSIADRETGRSEIRVSHRSLFKPDEVKTKIAALQTSFGEYMKNARALAKVKIDERKAAEFVEALLRETKTIYKKDVSKSPQANLILANFGGAGRGADLKPAKGTAWGLLNAVTQFVDHETRNKERSNALDSAWFGRGDDLKTETYNRLLALVA